jgi:hypothetical protein
VIIKLAVSGEEGVEGRTVWKSEESLVHSVSAWAVVVEDEDGASSQGDSSVSLSWVDANS